MTIAKQLNISSIIKDNRLSTTHQVIGKRFGKLVVDSHYGRRKYLVFYNCVCDCGNTCIISYSSLKNGKTKSCGCFHADVNRQVHSIDITGNKYGRLVAVSFAYRKNKNTYWNVVCDCGSTKQVGYSHLVRGKIKSCGCIKREILSSQSGENSHLWRGGVSTGKYSYPKEWNSALKKRIRDRDNHRCQYPDCGYSDLDEGCAKLDVHHIDGNKQNCSEYNLISLCHGHHMFVESEPSNWINYFYDIVGDYGYR